MSGCTIQQLPEEVFIEIASHCEVTADISAWCRTNKYFLSALRSYLFQRDVRDTSNFALTWAALFGMKRTAELSLQAGADPNKPYHFRCGHNAPNFRSLIIMELGSVREAFGWQPLHYASWRGHLHVMKLLVTGGADINGTTDGGATPLLVCDLRLVSIKFLEEHGANMSARGHDGRGALHYSVKRLNGPALQHFLNRGLLAENEHAGLLNYAAGYGNIDALSMLLKQSRFNADKKDGLLTIDVDQFKLLFYLALSGGHSETLRWLLNNEIKVFQLSDSEFDRAIWISKAREDSMVLDILLQEKLQLQSTDPS